MRSQNVRPVFVRTHPRCRLQACLLPLRLGCPKHMLLPWEVPRLRGSSPGSPLCWEGRAGKQARGCLGSNQVRETFGPEPAGLQLPDWDSETSWLPTGLETPLMGTANLQRQHRSQLRGPKAHCLRCGGGGGCLHPVPVSCIYFISLRIIIASFIMTFFELPSICIVRFLQVAFFFFC